VWQKIRTITRIRLYRRLAYSIAACYLLLFLIALQDITFSGRDVQVLTTHWTRMFERTGTFTFEPIVQVTWPGATILLSPVNLAIGSVLSLLVGLNLAVTTLAFRSPAACRFPRGTGLLVSLPALLAGGACCAPTVVLLLGLQVTSAFMTVFQMLIPASVILLLIALKIALDRTAPDRITA
jgi:hypothetical protein